MIFQILQNKLNLTSAHMHILFIILMGFYLALQIIDRSKGKLTLIDENGKKHIKDSLIYTDRIRVNISLEGIVHVEIRFTVGILSESAYRQYTESLFSDDSPIGNNIINIFLQKSFGLFEIVSFDPFVKSRMIRLTDSHKNRVRHICLASCNNRIDEFSYRRKE